MPRIPKSYCSPTKLICPVKACLKNCRTHSGLTQHIHAKHRDHRVAGTPPSPATVNDEGDLLFSTNDTSASDLQVRTWDSSGSDSSEHDSRIGFNFADPLVPTSQPDSPVQGSEASNSNTFSTEYHPLINGQ